LGGPSRYLAANYGCRVIGIDITEEYCRVASTLGAGMGLEDRVEYRRGDARELLFPDGTFDGAWTQHMSMNIAEKKELYEGICRVLKIGGRFAQHDVVQRTPGAILFHAASGTASRVTSFHRTRANPASTIVFRMASAD
jgi:MPBQ/MSBQ methyltransferase